MLAAILLLALVPAACGGDASPVETPTPTPQPPAEPEISDAARDYLNDALDILEENSVVRNDIDWPTLREEAFEVAGAAQNTAATYDAIRFAIDELGDNHSRFLTPSEASSALLPYPASMQAGAATQSIPRGIGIGDHFGYLAIPAFEGSGDPMRAFAAAIDAELRAADGPTVCGWVVDLRGNSGGNMWPMLAGVGPVLGEGIVGMFVDPDGVTDRWFYEDGTSGIRPQSGAENPIVTVPGPHQPAQAMPPVAVLTSGLTASSGEAIATAFRGRADARSFGQDTRGLSTGVEAFPLSDGARINLATTTFADRTGQLYGGVLPPDEEIVEREPGDAVLTAALGWLGAADACGGVPAPAPADASLTGEWQGPSNTSFELRLVLEQQEAGTIIGEGELGVGPAVQPCTITGEADAGVVGLILTCEGNNVPGRFDALLLEEDLLNGTLRADGLPDIAFTLTRQ